MDEKKSKERTVQRLRLDQAIRTGGDFECERCQEKKKRKKKNDIDNFNCYLLIDELNVRLLITVSIIITIIVINTIIIHVIVIIIPLIIIIIAVTVTRHYCCRSFLESSPTEPYWR